MRHVINHRHSEYRALMMVVLVVCGLAVLGSVLPIVEHVINLGVLGLVGLAVAVVLVRLGMRWVRERVEDAADARTAAAWPARHAPHLLPDHRTVRPAPVRPARVGVA